jgi:hypothetical protein
MVLPRSIRLFRVLALVVSLPYSCWLKRHSRSKTSGARRVVPSTQPFDPQSSNDKHGPFTAAIPFSIAAHVHWFAGATILDMVRGPSTKSRRRSQSPLGRKTFVYLTNDERELIDEAAGIERRSVSSFIANAAMRVAESVVAKQHSQKPPKSRRP